MLAPHTCAPIDVYDRYRTVWGKSDIAAGIGLPLTRLLEIQANNANQPCSSFGVHENLTEVKSLYDQGDLIFIANAGLLAKPVTTANYSGETPVQLFAHNSMQYDTARVDLFKEFAGTGKFKLCSIALHIFSTTAHVCFRMCILSCVVLRGWWKNGRYSHSIWSADQLVFD
jgi:hypothetical protein